MAAQQNYLIDDSLYHVLMRTIRCVDRYYGAPLRALNVTTGQLILLSEFAKSELPISKVAATLNADRTTMSRRLIPLLKKKYIQLTLSEIDRRVKVYKVTAHGHTLLNKALPILVKTDIDVNNKVGCQKMGTVKQMLENLCKMTAID